MGTGSYENINIWINGSISYDYTDEIYKTVVFKAELNALITRYGLTMEDKGDE